MVTKNCPSWLRSALIFSAFLLTLPAVCSPRTTAVDVQSAPQSGPLPPCGHEPTPPYPAVDAPPTVKSWSASDLGANWTPPPCTHWTTAGFTSLVTISARFRRDTKAQTLLQRVGAISQLSGVRYWSTTHQRWRTLITDAYALTDAQLGHRRADFTPDEMKEGAVLYFQQDDNLSGKAIYRMHIEKASADRIVFDIENVNTMRYFFISIVPPGELQSIYYLDRESVDVWRYYSIMRAGKRTNRLAAGNEKSAINRAVAAYRHYAGIPTDQEPPAAR